MSFIQSYPQISIPPAPCALSPFQRQLRQPQRHLLRSFPPPPQSPQGRSSATATRTHAPPAPQTNQPTQPTNQTAHQPPAGPNARLLGGWIPSRRRSGGRRSAGPERSLADGAEEAPPGGAGAAEEAEGPPLRGDGSPASSRAPGRGGIGGELRSSRRERERGRGRGRGEEEEEEGEGARGADGRGGQAAWRHGGKELDPERRRCEGGAGEKEEG